MTTAGDLRETVEIQAPPAVPDDSGGQVGGWTRVARVRASVKPLSGSEAVIAGAESAVSRYIVTVRMRTFDSGQRLLWRGNALDIRAILPRRTREFIDLTCEATRP